MQDVGVFLRGASLRRKIASTLLFAAGVVGVSALALVLASLRTPEGERLVPGFVEHGLIPPIVQPLASPQATASGATPAASARPTPSGTTTPTTPPPTSTPVRTPAATQGPPSTFPGRTPPPHPSAP